MSTEQLIDYYALLGVPRDVSRTDIERKIKQEYRVWQKRTNLSDLNQRQEAETRVKQLTDAKRTLLDGDARRAYDLRLASYQPPVPPVDLVDKAGADWLAQARRHLARNDYNSALYCAREARQTRGVTAEVWNTLSRANAGLGNFHDAVYEAQQASALGSGNPAYHYELGAIYEQLDQWDAAMSAYHTVDRLEPGSDAAKVAIAGVLIQTGRPDQALRILEPLYVHGQDKRLAGDYLGMALIESAEELPVSRDGDGYLVTSPGEISRMRNYLGRAAQVTNDPEIYNEMRRINEYLHWCSSRHFQRSGARLGGCLGRIAARAFQDHVGDAGSLVTKVDDLRRVALVGERSSGKTSGPFTDFSLPPELRCWFILSSPTRTRQHWARRHRVSRVMSTFRRPRSRVVICWNASPRCRTGVALRAGITRSRWCSPCARRRSWRECARSPRSPGGSPMCPPGCWPSSTTALLRCFRRRPRCGGC
jgi:Flp pilus assembly protein TadD